MKTVKKWMAVLFAFMLTLTMAAPAFADDTSNGSITIHDTVSGQSYSVYRIFDLESYNKDTGAYLYTVNSDWEGFINQTTISGDKAYVSVNGTTGLVTWAKKDDKGNAVGAEDFAELALAWAKDNNIQPVQENTAGGDTVRFNGLKLGYYLVDSSLGALCVLNTTAPAVEITEKNGQPTVDKQVLEGDRFGTEASAQVGDVVTFQSTITVQAGAENYVLHDTMTAGLAFNRDSVKVYLNPTVDSATGKITGNPTPLTDTGNYILMEAANPCTFHVEFTKTFCDSLQVDDKIVVNYTATLTADAVQTGVATNETHLGYGDNARTTSSEVEVYTYKFQLVKTDEGKTPDGGTDKVYTLLTGAEFQLYAVETGGDPIKLVKETGEAYHVASDQEINNGAAVDVIEAGAPVIKGLDNKDYWLEETKAPDGYNELTARIKVTVSGDNLAGANTIDTTKKTYTPDAAHPGGVHIENHAGSMLPTTGGIGTTVFYMLGSVLVIGATILLVLRRRGSSEGK